MNHADFKIVGFASPRNVQEQHAEEFIARNKMADKKRRTDRITTIALIVAVVICAIGGTILISILS